MFIATAGAASCRDLVRSEIEQHIVNDSSENMTFCWCQPSYKVSGYTVLFFRCFFANMQMTDRATASIWTCLAMFNVTHDQKGSPVKCPKCSFEQPDANTECGKCGIVFEKYRMRESSVHRSVATTAGPTARTQNVREAVSHLLFYTKSESNEILLAGRLFLFLLLFVWGWKFIFSSIESNSVGASFLHLVNLPFHEAGHLFFKPFGRFLHVLGGTLGQLIMPMLCLVVFILKTRDPFGGSVALWWTGQNFMDIAPYINDARALKLTLLGGVTGRETVDYHDWEFILRQMGWLKLDHTIAAASKSIGTVLMILSFIWGAYLLFLQYRIIKKK